MLTSRQYAGIHRYLNGQTTSYLALYGSGVVLAIVLMITTGTQDLWGLTFIAGALLLILCYLFGALWWSTQYLYDDPDYVTLFHMSDIRETDTFVVIDLGRRDASMALHRYLTTGQVVVIDVYHPQLTPDPLLRAIRRSLDNVEADTRLSWRDGHIDLLSLPDNSVPSVIMPNVLSHFWQQGDQVRLLKEVRRILQPGGQLLISERVRSRTNWLVLGLVTFRLDNVDSWRQLIQDNGFQIKHEKSHYDLSHCFLAEKPTPTRAKQLGLPLQL